MAIVEEASIHHFNSSHFLHELIHCIFVFPIQDLIVLHQVDLEQHVLRVPDKLSTHLGRLFIGLKLWVLLARIQSLLVRVNLRLDLPRCDQFCQLCLDDLQWQTES